jgi:DNA-binding NarL/FixJ family response regulator
MIRVALVDDDAELRKLFRIILELEGAFHVVGEAGDGKSAIRLAQECQPDLVLLDLEMPVMDGLDALPLILESAPQTKVVVVSGFPADSMADSARAAGAVAYLSKGISANALVDELRSVMEA